MLSTLLGRFWGYLAAISGALAITGLWTLKAFSAGRAKERAKANERTLDAVSDKAALERELDSPDARAKLRDKHYRD